MRLATPSLAMIAVGGTLIFGAVSPASANTTLDPAAQSFMTQQFQKYNVPQSQWAGLFEKEATNVAFDSATGVAPTSTEKFRVGITDYTLKRFADGSFSASSLERPTIPTARAAGGVTPLAITGCSYYYGTGVASYSNCKVMQDTPAATLWFKADYYRSSGAAGVSRVSSWDWNIQCAAATCTLNYLGIVKSTWARGAGQQARGRIRAYATVVGGLGSAYPYVDIVVTPSSATSSANF